MIEKAALRFAIRTTDGRMQELTVDADTARIGSGSQCEIRLAAEDAAIEQLLVRARSGGVFGEARAMEPPVLLNGAPFVQGRLLPESLLKLGSVELSVSLLDRRLAAGSQARKSGDPRRLLGAIAVAAVSLLLTILIVQEQGPGAETAVAPPPLWPEGQAHECAQRDPESAAALAEKHRLQAEAARERAPFSPQDGVQAVESFAQAAACYLTANSLTAAEQVRLSLDVLKRELERDFHVHTVRLERALATECHDQARTEVRILLSFGARRTEPYFGWLSNLERQIVLKFSGKKS